jgi:hypothetical protein
MTIEACLSTDSTVQCVRINEVGGFILPCPGFAGGEGAR